MIQTAAFRSENGETTLMKQLRVALVGKAGGGKDYFASHVAGQMPTLRAAYADALKAGHCGPVSGSNVTRDERIA